MRLGRTLTALIIAIFSVSAGAQVHRCKDANGKLIFSDRLCDSAQSGELVQRKRTREEILREREQAFDAENRKQARRMAEQERELVEQGRRSRQVQAMPQVQQPAEDWQSRKNRENAATSAGSIANNGSRFDQNAEAERARARREEALRHQAANPPAMITSCNAGFCSDTNGNTYYRNGNNLNGTDGRVCTIQAGYAHCN